ncbi:hypothetical protein [Pseudonocardia sp. TRM90224]|uniref:hypothetical protein n=1 Tax=Pseudonocardia sp. TRM90224 TaxID=2812678 RepID=UPI001E48E7EA|nr:hypothetical protein [Pseudonocardia sp. TRM90224]
MTLLRSCALVVAVVVLAGCGPAEPVAAPPEEVPHGYVAGAEEVAEAQSRLVVADGDTGTVRVLDLTTEQVLEVAGVGRVEAISGDGRFAYLTTGGGVHVVDGGSWMVDHGDHVHYYRTQPRDAGVLPGAGLTDVHSDPVVSAVSRSDGSVVLLDRARLDAGAVVPEWTMTGPAHLAHAVPYREHVLVSVAREGQERADAVEVRTRRGDRVAALQTPCPALQGSALTRRGAVFGCADGALLVTERDGVFTGTKIPYPRPVPDGERVREFAHRPGSSTLAGPAGERGVWSLDLARAEWTFVETGPVVAVNTPGEGAPLLALTADGVLHGYDVATGRETAQVALLRAPVPAGAPPPVIQVDPTRAYVNDPAAGSVHEIDYNDDLRRARTFDVPSRPAHVVETGR